MPLELGLSDAGLQVPRLADYLEEIRDSYRADTGIDVDWDSDLVLGVLTAIMAKLLDQQAEALQAVWDGFGVNQATGVQLSNIALLSGVARKKATRSQAVLTLIGDPGTVIAEGKLVEGGGLDGRSRWEISEDVTLDGAGEGEVIGIAVESGRTVALAGEIDAIVTPVTGWDSVGNPGNASIGLDAESDADLRVRRQQSIQLSGGIGIGALRAKILDLDFIESCSVIDNPDNDPQIVEEISLPAHSYLIIILPATLTAGQKTELAQLIYSSVGVASRSAGTSEVVTLTGADGFNKSISWDYAVEVEANLEINLTMSIGYSIADAGVVLRALVEDYIGTITIGQPLLQLRIAALAATIPGVIGMVADVNGSPNLQVSAIEQIVPGSWSVT